MNETKTASIQATSSASAKTNTAPTAAPLTKPKRPLSAYNLFYRHKREKVITLPTDNSSKQAVVNLITAPPGLEDYSSATLQQMSPAEVLELQRTNIRSSMAHNLKPRDNRKRSHHKNSNAFNGSMTFLELGKLMNATWQNCNAGAKSVFRDLADEGRAMYQERLALYTAQVERNKGGQTSNEGGDTDGIGIGAGGKLVHSPKFPLVHDPSKVKAGMSGDTCADDGKKKTGKGKKRKREKRRVTSTDEEDNSNSSESPQAKKVKKTLPKKGKKPKRTHGLAELAVAAKKPGSAQDGAATKTASQEDEAQERYKLIAQALGSTNNSASASPVASSTSPAVGVAPIVSTHGTTTAPSPTGSGINARDVSRYLSVMNDLATQVKQRRVSQPTPPTVSQQQMLLQGQGQQGMRNSPVFKPPLNANPNANHPHGMTGQPSLGMGGMTGGGQGANANPVAMMMPRSSSLPCAPPHGVNSYVHPNPGAGQGGGSNMQASNMQTFNPREAILSRVKDLEAQLHAAKLQARVMELETQLHHAHASLQAGSRRSTMELTPAAHHDQAASFLAGSRRLTMDVMPPAHDASLASSRRSTMDMPPAHHVYAASLANSRRSSMDMPPTHRVKNNLPATHRRVTMSSVHEEQQDTSHPKASPRTDNTYRLVSLANVSMLHALTTGPQVVSQGSSKPSSSPSRPRPSKRATLDMSSLPPKKRLGSPKMDAEQKE